MARTIQEIYDAIILEKQNTPMLNALQPSIDDSQTLLNDLTSTSKVAVWRLWAWVMAAAIYLHESLWDIFKKEIEDLAAAAIPGTARWLRDQCYIFQLGYALQWINNKYQYSVIDPAARIVQRAAVVDTGGQVTIKVAKLVGTTVTPLSTPELNAFDAYINQIKFAGTQTVVISRTADLLRIYMDIYYDPLVLDATGGLLSNPTVKPAEDAINNYISNLPFNGELVLTKLIDAVQQALGVTDPVLQTAEARYGGVPYAFFTVSYLPDAGHMKVDPSFPLFGTLNYIADV